MRLADFIFLRGELAAIKLGFGGEKIVHEFKRFADVVKIGDVDDDF